MDTLVGKIYAHEVLLPSRVTTLEGKGARVNEAILLLLRSPRALMRLCMASARIFKMHTHESRSERALRSHVLESGFLGGSRSKTPLFSRFKSLIWNSFAFTWAKIRLSNQERAESRSETSFGMWFWPMWTQPLICYFIKGIANFSSISLDVLKPQVAFQCKDFALKNTELNWVSRKHSKESCKIGMDVSTKMICNSSFHLPATLKILYSNIMLFLYCCYRENIVSVSIFFSTIGITKYEQQAAYDIFALLCESTISEGHYQDI